MNLPALLLVLLLLFVGASLVVRWRRARNPGRAAMVPACNTVRAQSLSMRVCGQPIAELMDGSVGFERAGGGVIGRLNATMALLAAPTVDLMARFFGDQPVEVMFDVAGATYRITGPISKALVLTGIRAGSSIAIELVGPVTAVVSGEPPALDPVAATSSPSAASTELAT